MPSLQIRNVPDDVYQGLALRAERAQRSLAQQALVELRGAAGQLQSRRRSILEAIKRSLPSESSAITLRPDELIRDDRER
jgi:antitoxin FitA